MSPVDPFAPQLQLCTGKGGVGKSTVIAALATEAARRGHHPLVVAFDGAGAALARALGSEQPLSSTPTEVRASISGVELERQAMLTEYIAAHVKIRRLAKRIAESTALTQFSRAAPSVEEVTAMHHILQLMDQRDGEHARFHPILVDLDATGHALMFLGLPQLYQGLVLRGPIRKLMQRVSETLSDPEQCRVHIVTRPGHLPMSEALELGVKLHRDYDVAMGALFINQVQICELSEDVRRTSIPPRGMGMAGNQGASRTARTALRMLAEAVDERDGIAEFREAFAQSVPLPSVLMPYLPLDPSHPRAVQARLDTLGRCAATWIDAS